MYRDISVGNIVVFHQMNLFIDWDHAKLIDQPSCTQTVSTFSSRQHFGNQMTS